MNQAIKVINTKKVIYTGSVDNSTAKIRVEVELNYDLEAKNTVASYRTIAAGITLLKSSDYEKCLDELKRIVALNSK